jgi:hypothetical protein
MNQMGVSVIPNEWWCASPAAPTVRREVRSDLGGDAGGWVRRFPLKAVLLLPALGLAWVAFCLVDLVGAKQVRYLPT